MSFQSVIEKYRSSATSPQELGALFERLIRAFLKTYQLYEGKFKEVWLWSEFPYRDKLSCTDVGIDLVCKVSETEYWAVQCKCYSDNTTIKKGDVDTFLSTSSRTFEDADGRSLRFAYRLLVYTTDNWNSNAEASLHNQDPKVLRLKRSKLESAQVDWEKLDADISGADARLETFELRPHQKEALEAVHTHFLEHDRGKLIPAPTEPQYLQPLTAIYLNYMVFTNPDTDRTTIEDKLKERAKSATWCPNPQKDGFVGKTKNEIKKELRGQGFKEETNHRQRGFYVHLPSITPEGGKSPVTRTEEVEPKIDSAEAWDLLNRYI